MLLARFHLAKSDEPANPISANLKRPPRGFHVRFSNLEP